MKFPCGCYTYHDNGGDVSLVDRYSCIWKHTEDNGPRVGDTKEYWEGRLRKYDTYCKCTDRFYPDCPFGTPAQHLARFSKHLDGFII